MTKNTNCADCNSRPIDRKTAGRDSTLCRLCWDYAGAENEHNDNGHDVITEPNESLAAEIAVCPVCNPELDPRNETKRNWSSHAECKHESTKSARAKCRKQRQS